MQIMTKFKTYHPYLLFPLALLYWGVVVWRNFFYRYNFFLKRRLPCKVISIGNITLGGTGKTPTVLYLCSLLVKQGNKVSILSRGYGRRTKGTVLVSSGNGPLCKWEEAGDEPFMLAKKLKGIPIVVDEDRFRGGIFLVNNYDPDIIIMDDGFQHRSLLRDLDIVLLNGSDKRADYKLLPYGKLREPWINIKRADVLLITKKVPGPFLKREVLETKLPCLQTKISAEVFKIKNNLETSLKQLMNIKVLLLSGIGDSEHFKQTAIYLGCIVGGVEAYPDHFKFTNKEILIAEKKANEVGADYIMTTEKDWVKLRNLNLSFPIAVIEIGIRVVDEARLLHLIQRKLYSKSAPFPKQRQLQQM